MLIKNQTTGSSTAAQSAQPTVPNADPAKLENAAGESGFEVLRGTSSFLDATSGNTPPLPPTTVKPNEGLFGAIFDRLHMMIEMAKARQEIVDKAIHDIN